ncbi:MAG: FAD-binding oxidoreductase [Candidatus Caldarchaeum sp.]|nr:FAD-binding oxidoreductase [Candidatus Caldarchaeum sp.]
MADFDIIVVGGGILGLASAYYMKLHNKNLSVVVIDKEKEVGQGNTARSVGGYRQGIFTSRVNQVLAETTIQNFREAEASGEAKLGMNEVGYLIVMDKQRYSKVAGVVESFIQQGKAELLEAPKLTEYFGMQTSFQDDEEAEMLGIDNVVYGLFAPRCGFLDVDKVVGMYKKRCKDVGVEFILGKHVDSLILEPVKPLGIPNEPRVWQKVRVAGAAADGENIRASYTVVAAGSWCPQILDPIGVDCFIKPKKRQLFVIQAAGELEYLLNRSWKDGKVLPMIFFPNGLYVVPRSMDKAFWVGLTDEIGRRFGLDNEPEPSYFYDNVYPPLVKYFPHFANSRPSAMWAGNYSMNYLDGNPLVFKFLNCLVVTGGSGSGVMKSDAVGRIAEAVLFDKPYATLHGGIKFDVSILGIENRRVDKEYLIL